MNVGEQISLFDLGICSLKMSSDYSVATGGEISEESSKKPQESSQVIPQFLDCRKARVGLMQGAFWETDGLSLGGYQMRSFGEHPKEDAESRLSQILEARPHPKYSLSVKACQGILKRSERRGRVLPQVLKDALERQIQRQSHSLNVPDVVGGGKGILIQEERTGTLGTVAIQNVFCIGNGQADRTERMTPELADALNCMHDQQIVCYSQDAYDKLTPTETSAALRASGGNNGGGARR